MTSINTDQVNEQIDNLKSLKEFVQTIFSLFLDSMILMGHDNEKWKIVFNNHSEDIKAEIGRFINYLQEDFLQCETIIPEDFLPGGKKSIRNNGNLKLIFYLAKSISTYKLFLESIFKKYHSEDSVGYKKLQDNIKMFITLENKILKTSNKISEYFQVS